MDKRKISSTRRYRIARLEPGYGFLDSQAKAKYLIRILNAYSTSMHSGIEEVNTAASRPVVTATSRGRATQQGRTVTIADAATQRRQTQRRLAELERENYHDTRIDIPKEMCKPSSEAMLTRQVPRFQGSTASVRKILASRKTLVNLIDELVWSMYTGSADQKPDPSRLNGIIAAPSRYPGTVFCTMCDYWGHYTCMRCGARYCSKQCEILHLETRCLKAFG